MMLFSLFNPFSMFKFTIRPKAYRVFHFTSVSSAPPEYTQKLADDESVISCFRTTKDYAVFTNKRLLITDVTGPLGKRTDSYMLPYQHIVMFNKESHGVLDFDSRLNFFMQGNYIIRLTFDKKRSIKDELQKIYELLSDILMNV